MIFSIGMLIVWRTKGKTAGRREIPLNADALAAFARLKERAEVVGGTDPEHYVFPSCERRRIRSDQSWQKTWRTAWRSLCKEAARLAGRAGCRRNPRKDEEHAARGGCLEASRHPVCRLPFP